MFPEHAPFGCDIFGSENWVNRYDVLQVVWLDSHLKEGDTAIDVGAHYGIYSILMAAKSGQGGHVVAFEPDPYAREVLARNIALNPDLKPPVIESAACSDEIGEAILFSRGGNAQSSLVRSAAGIFRYRQVRTNCCSNPDFGFLSGRAESCASMCEDRRRRGGS